MSAYLDAFPTIQYTFSKDRKNFLTLRNIFTRVKMIHSTLLQTLVYYEYAMKDSDTLEGIAYKYYGSATRHWIIILSNSIIDPYFDIPLKARDFQNNLVLKYGSIEAAQNTLHHIQQSQNVTTITAGGANSQVYLGTVNPTELTYDFKSKQLKTFTTPTIQFPVVQVALSTVSFPDGSVVTTNTQLQAVSCYDYENTLNESKRQIKLVDASYVSQIEAEFASLLSDG